MVDRFGEEVVVVNLGWTGSGTEMNQENVTGRLLRTSLARDHRSIYKYILGVNR